MTTAAVTSQDLGRWTYRGLAALCLAVAVLGFVPTFFLPLAQGAFARSPVFYLHIVLFYAWTLFVCAQAWLAASGRVAAHREWGVLGAAIAVGMVFSVMSVVVVRLNQVPPIAQGPGSASFAWLDLAGMLYFGGCIWLGFAHTRRPETHRRLMLLATLSLMNAPIARWTGVIFPAYADPAFAPRPFIVNAWFHLAAGALMALAMVLDRRADGRLSRVYAMGLPAYLVLMLTTDAVGASPAWLAVADWLRSIPG